MTPFEPAWRGNPCRCRRPRGAQRRVRCCSLGAAERRTAEHRSPSPVRGLPADRSMYSYLCHVGKPPHSKGRRSCSPCSRPRPPADPSAPRFGAPSVSCGPHSLYVSALDALRCEGHPLGDGCPWRPGGAALVVDVEEHRKGGRRRDHTRSRHRHGQYREVHQAVGARTHGAQVTQARDSASRSRKARALPRAHVARTRA